MSFRHRQTAVPEQEPSPDAPDQLAQALAQLKDPPAVSALVGAVIRADGTADVSQQADSSATDHPKRKKARTHAPLADPAASSVAVGALAPAPSSSASEEPQVARTPHSPASSPLLVPADVTSPNKPRLKDESVFARAFRRVRQKILTPRVRTPDAPPLPNTSPTAVVTPTNPEPDALIAEHIAEKERAATERRSENASFPQATFAQQKIDRRRLYQLGAIWLCAVPLASGLYGLLHLLLGERISEPLGNTLMVAVYVCGLYGLVGWIPLVLLYIYPNNPD